jgi:predicted ATP-grasp superfamily ATP-dependent carboligase
MGKIRTIFLLDGEQRSTLAVTRSLGRAGIKVIVGEEKKKSLSGCSKFCHSTTAYRSPYYDAKNFIKDIIATIEKKDIDMLVPMTDITTYQILANEKLLRKMTIVPTVQYKQYMHASNKIEMVCTAKKLGIPVPESLVIKRPSHIKRGDFPFEFPVILKPEASLIVSEDKVDKCGVQIANSIDDIRDAMENKPAFQKPFMIQKRLKGVGIGVFALFDNGKPVAMFSHKRLREKPPWGGVSVLSESAPPDPEAERFAMKLLEHLNWQGVAMVEFKRDHITGLPNLMEINARFWGTLQLSIFAGVDFPMMLYRLATGDAIPYRRQYEHVVMRWLLGDLDALYITLKELKNTPYRFNDNTSATNSIRGFVSTFFQPVKNQVLWRNDLRPFFWELRQYLASIL